MSEEKYVCWECGNDCPNPPESTCDRCLDAPEARIKKLEEKLNEAHSLLSTVSQAGGKKHHRFAVGVPQDDCEVSFLTASFMKKVKVWLITPPTQEGEE